MNEFRSGCGVSSKGEGEPERAERQLKMWGTLFLESPPMKPEARRLSATNVAKVMKVAESQNGESLRYFRHLTMQTRAGSRVDYLTVSLVRRLAFTAIGVIMVLWAWTLLSSQITRFPNVDPLTVFVGVFTIFLGISNVLSIIRDVTWKQAFLTIAFVVVMSYITWFA